MSKRFLPSGQTAQSEEWLHQIEGADAPELPASPMNVRQVADYLGVGEAIARHLFRTGQVAAFKVGGRWRARPEDVTDYILKKLQKP